jgi:hypothetical protein
MPSISTNNDLPFEFVQLGPGETQRGGVGPGVSHRFADPPATLVVMPGENGLAEKDADPVLLAVMSVTRTTSGVHWTRGFQEAEVVAWTVGTYPAWMAATNETSTMNVGRRIFPKNLLHFSRV